MEQKSTYSFVLKCKFSEIFPENELEKLFTTINELFKGYNSFADENEEYPFPKLLFSFKSDGINQTVKFNIGYSEIQEEIFDKLLKKEKENFNKQLKNFNEALEKEKEKLRISSNKLEAEKRKLEEEKNKLQAEWKEITFLKEKPELPNKIDEDKLALEIEKELREEYGLQQISN